MKIAFLGDSITEGCCVNDLLNLYVNVVGKNLDCEVKNYGVCGTRIAPQTHIDINLPSSFNETFLTRAKTMDKDADIVVIFGGTNDFGHGDALMGEISDKAITFCGELNALFDYIKCEYSRAKIIVILPLHRWDEDSIHGDWFGYKNGIWPKLEKYRENIKNIADLHGFLVFDPINYLEKPLDNKPSKYFADGLHPNDYGSKILGNELTKFIRKNL